jgi:micrococcal nuclease
MNYIRKMITNHYEHRNLEKYTKETPMLNMKGNAYLAKVVYIYDGDTMHVVFKEFGSYYRWNCRIIGVDTPELRTKNEEEKKMGYEVRDILRDMFMNKIVTVNTFDFDKYGRLLIDIVFEDEELNETTALSEWLVKHNYAYSYNGGTKKAWE